MPAATQYTPDDREVRAAAEQELRERQRHYQQAWRYYSGEHRTHLQVGPDGVDDNVRLNLCRQVIDRTVAFLVPEFPVLTLDGEGEEIQAAQAYLRDVWQHSGGASLLYQLALYGALSGHVFARVIPAGAGESLPRIVPLNPAQVTVFWSAADVQRVLWYEVYWQEGRHRRRQDIINEGTHWRIQEYMLVGSRWQAGEDAIWNDASGPLVDWPHLVNPAAYYGQDELPHAELNDLVNRVASDIARILRFHAYPRTIGTGFEAGQVQETAIDNLWVIPNADATVKNLEMQSDLSASLRFMELLTANFLSESRVVLPDTEPGAFRDVTNMGIRARYMDLLAKTQQLWRGYRGGMEALSRRILLAGGLPREQALSVPLTIHRAEALPVDQPEVVDLVRQQVELGVMSPQTAAASLGLDYEQEQTRGNNNPVPGIPG